MVEAVARRNEVGFAVAKAVVAVSSAIEFCVAGAASQLRLHFPYIGRERNLGELVTP